MGFKSRALRLRGLAATMADAKKILEVIDDDKFMRTTYGQMTAATGFSQQRVEQAVYLIQRTTREIEYVNVGPPFSFRRKHQRPCSSSAEHVLGKDGVASSILALGSIQQISPSPKIHYWPDGPPGSHRKPLELFVDYQLWCGTSIGGRCWNKQRNPLSYYWSKNIKKVTCKSCQAKFSYWKAEKSKPEVRTNIVEVS